MQFEAQQSYIKHSGYYFIKIIHYRVNTSLTKQHKSTAEVGWLLLWGARDFSHFEQENNLGRQKTGSCIH
jgi:hypothetical protein